LTDREPGLRGTSTRGRAALAEVSILLAAFFVGTDIVSVKYALEGFPPLVLMPIRYTLAGLLLLTSLRLLRRGIGLVPQDLAALAGLGLVGVSLNQVGYTVGLSLTSGSDAALIFASAPVWGLLLGAVLGLERPTAGGVLGLALALGGVALVVGEGLGSGGASVGGDLLVVGGWTMLLGGGAVLPLALIGFPGLSEPLSSVDWGAVGIGSWAAALYSTLLCSSFAIAAWQVNVSRLGANRVLIYLYLVTLVGLLASVVVLGEDFGMAKIAGAAALLLGVYLARRS
jgi:drug/metabolite transporter (DMT)-like permease